MPPLIPIIIGWLVGLIAAHYILVPVGFQPGATALVTLIPLASIPFCRRNRSIVLVLGCALAFLGGALRYQWHVASLHGPEAVVQYNGQGPVILEGVVKDYPSVRDGWTGLVVEAQQLESELLTIPASGRILVRTSSLPTYRYGDQLRLRGQLQTPPEGEAEGFSYRQYLAQRSILSQMGFPSIQKLSEDQGNRLWTWIFALRERAHATITRLMPEPEASLLNGILLGLRSGIPRDLYEDYNRTGASHIIVISGANIMVVAELFRRSFGLLLGARKAYWFTLAGIGLYVLLVGADAVVVRAGIMSGLLITAVYLGRRAAAYVSLAAAALLLTAINPLTLWDVGFQLSVAATMGLILFTEPLEAAAARLLMRMMPQRIAEVSFRFLSGVLVVTLAAQALTLPLIIHYFGRLSLVAPLTNLLIGPLQPHIMYTGAAATFIGLFPSLEPVARVAAMIPWLLLAITNTIVRWTASWPLASLEVSGFPGGWVVAFYALILGFLWVSRRKSGGVPLSGKSIAAHVPSGSILGLSLAAIILTGLAMTQLPDGLLHVAFLDVGQGDAILITTPAGHQILVDGGPHPGVLAAALGREMPFWDREIDLVILTHSDLDHVGGLSGLLERYQIGGWLDSGLESESEVHRRCLELLSEGNVPRHVAQVGDRLDLGDGASLEVLHPDPREAQAADGDSNDASLVLRLVWGEASFLLTGDLGIDGESQLLRSGRSQSTDVLKVGHHGSAASSSRAFLEALSPVYAVISVGAENRFGHPDPALLERLEGMQVLRTDEQGTVEFTTDGMQLWLHTGN